MHESTIQGSEGRVDTRFSGNGNPSCRFVDSGVGEVRNSVGRCGVGITLEVSRAHRELEH